MTNTQYTKREKLLFYEFFRTDYSHIEYFKEKEHQYLQYDVSGVTKRDLEVITEVKCRDINSNYYKDYFVEFKKFISLYKIWLVNKNRIFTYTQFFNDSVVNINLNCLFVLHQQFNLNFLNSYNTNIKHAILTQRYLPTNTYSGNNTMELKEIIVIQKNDLIVTKQPYYNSIFLDNKYNINYNKVNNFILKRFPNNNS